MFKKLKLKRQIKQCMKQIKAIEQKRSRSQSALIEAILEHVTPNDTDTDYFNKYTSQINDIRKEMHVLQEELKDYEN